MKRILAILLTAIMMTGLLTGCGGSTSTSSTDSGKGKSEGETKTLQVLWFNDGNEGETFRRLADQYEEENPNIKIEMIEVPFSELENKIKNMLNGNEAPAMARMSVIGQFLNQFLDLGDYVSDREAFIDNFNEGVKYVFDDKIVAAPMEVTATGLVYNKTAFEQAGVQVPQSEDEIWTWAEFKEALQKVVANSDCSYGLAYDFTFHRFSTLLYQAGGGMLSEDLTKSAYNSPENKAAVEYFKGLHDDGVVPTSVWLGSDNPNELFRAGQAAVHWAGSWMVANYKNEITDFEWGVTYLPRGEQRSSIPGGKMLTAFQNTGVEQESADFIEWISKAENNAVYCQENNFLSQVKGNEHLEYDYGTDLLATFSKELEASSSRPGAEWGYTAFTGAIQADGKDKLTEVLAGSLSVDDYLTEMDEIAQETLNELK